jgi:hypothetical protein
MSDTTSSLSERAARGIESAPVEPPVVARLVVEIRSDGTTTIARAGLCDERSRESSVLEARGSTPLALALSLARHLVELTRPMLGRSRRPAPVLAHEDRNEPE